MFCIDATVVITPIDFEIILSDSKDVFDTWLSCIVIYVPLSRLAYFVGYFEINDNISMKVIYKMLKPAHFIV
jgi:hypothetical protein